MFHARRSANLTLPNWPFFDGFGYFAYDTASESEALAEDFGVHESCFGKVRLFELEPELRKSLSVCAKCIIPAINFTAGEGGRHGE
jgi:hypothetical protein